MNQIFIGKSIEYELRNQERSVMWLARKLNCNRTNIYKIFNRSTIDTELLLRISNVLQRNFFEEYINRLDFTKEADA
ncbi:MAG: XRE family transcriptional regulator [Muribaculaceae bacterium]|nr:XRE family transcriptional regulator [Muribaculaceae bacterium]